MNDKFKKEYISYVLGKIETYVEGYSTSSQIPFRELAQLVAEFLYSKAGGELLGHTDRMPALLNKRRGVGRPRKEGRPSVAEVAVLGNSHRGMSEEARLKISKAMKASWQAKKKPIHWTQTAEGRKKMALRAKKFWKEGTWKGRAQK